MWDSLELEDYEENNYEYGLQHQGQVSQEHSKGLV